MLPKSNWAGLIPHAGSMCLLDAVLDWDAESIHATSASHARADNPLRGPHGLHAVCMAEYGAQAMAVHGALLARARGDCAVRAGMLVSVRDLVLHAEYVDALPGHLDVHASCLHAAPEGAQYDFRVAHAGRLLASGRATVMYPDPP
ncbi:MAG: phosphotransferase [Xanthomonadales bacterium]|nr:phosphotransferase [Xanthomonadales bacterium]